MNKEVGIQILRLKRKLADLENRLNCHEHWTAGEKEIYQQQFKNLTLKLSALNKIQDNY